MEGESWRVKTVGVKNYPLLKEELEESGVFEAAVNSARRNGFDFYELPLSDHPEGDMKRGIVMHYSPWDWEFVMTRLVSTNDQKKYVANVALAKVLDENTTLFAAMENLVVLSAEGYMTYHLPESPKQMRIAYLDSSNPFYQAVYDAPQGELTMLSFPDGSEHLSYVLTDRYHNNKLILMQSIEDLNRQKRDLARFNRMIEAINLVLIGVLVWVFSSGFFERQE